MSYEEVMNLKTPDDLWKYMHDNIKYGWTNKNGEFREYNDSRQNEEYYIHSPKETVERKSGICSDQVLLEKDWFDWLCQYCKDFPSREHGFNTLVLWVTGNTRHYFRSYPSCRAATHQTV